MKADAARDKDMKDIAQKIKVIGRDQHILDFRLDDGANDKDEAQIKDIQDQ